MNRPKDLNAPSRWNMRIWDVKKMEWLGESDNDGCIFYGFDIRGGETTLFSNMDWLYTQVALGREFIWEQSTGLKDKNGKEIYMGDIVKYLSYRKDYIGQVVFDFVDDSEGYYIEKHYGWGIYRDGYNTSLGDYADDNMRCELVEVIGNVHENPDLLEDK